MTRDEIIETVRSIFGDGTSEEEVSVLVEKLIDALNTDEVITVLFHGPTVDPELVADQLLKLPPRRILVTPPPESS